MPLSPAADREPIHTRQVICRGYRRADGLWDIEGHLTDVKSYDFESRLRGSVRAGEPVHEMWIRITLDDELVIREIEAVTDRSPFPVCPAITPNFQRLRGLAVKPGFLSKVRERVGGVEGCTHLVELMGPLATTAFQTIAPLRDKLRGQQEGGDPPPGGKLPRPGLLDSCHAFASDGEVVKRVWPAFYTGGRD